MSKYKLLSEFTGNCVVIKAGTELEGIEVITTIPAFVDLNTGKQVDFIIGTTIPVDSDGNIIPITTDVTGNSGGTKSSPPASSATVSSVTSNSAFGKSALVAGTPTATSTKKRIVLNPMYSASSSMINIDSNGIKKTPIIVDNLRLAKPNQAIGKNSQFRTDLGDVMTGEAKYVKVEINSTCTEYIPINQVEKIDYNYVLIFGGLAVAGIITYLIMK